MTEHDVLNVRMQAATEAKAYAAHLPRLACAVSAFVWADVKLFFRPVRIALITHLLLASVLFVAIGTSAVLLELAADIVTSRAMPPEFAISLRYLAHLIIWLDMAVASLLIVKAFVRQLRDLARTLSA